MAWGVSIFGKDKPMSYKKNIQWTVRYYGVSDKLPIGVQTFCDRERASAYYLEKLFLANDDDVTPLPRMFEETIETISQEVRLAWEDV